MNAYQPEPAVILIIDTDPLALTGVAAVLNMSGYECHCAQDEEAARKAAASLPLDLIICDVNLNGISGVDLCDSLRDQPGVSDVPLMFVSSNQRPDIIRRVNDAGGVYHLRKPFDPNVLTELVDKALWMPHLVRTRLERANDESSSIHVDSHSEPIAPSSPGGKRRSMLFS